MAEPGPSGLRPCSSFGDLLVLVAPGPLLVLPTGQLVARCDDSIVTERTRDSFVAGNEGRRLPRSRRQTYPPPLGPPTSATYSARLSLGCGPCPLGRNRRRRVSLAIQIRTRDAARVRAGNRPSNEQDGQIAQKAASSESDRMGTAGSPHTGQRCMWTGGASGRRPGTAPASATMDPYQHHCSALLVQQAGEDGRRRDRP
jgi:hypothetical protein